MIPLPDIIQSLGIWRGKHYRCWSVIAIFVLSGIPGIPREVLNFWKQISQLFPLIFCQTTSSTGIRVLEVEIDKLIKTAIEAFGRDKVELPSFHNLYHIPQFIPTLGVPLNYYLGKGESKHKFLLKQILHSDHRAVSFDLLSQGITRFCLSFVLQGGKWGSKHQLEAGADLKQISKHPAMKYLPNLFEEVPKSSSILGGEPTLFQWEKGRKVKIVLSTEEIKTLIQSILSFYPQLFESEEYVRNTMDPFILPCGKVTLGNGNSYKEENTILLNPDPDVEEESQKFWIARIKRLFYHEIGNLKFVWMRIQYFERSSGFHRQSGLPYYKLSQSEEEMLMPPCIIVGPAVMIHSYCHSLHRTKSLPNCYQSRHQYQSF